MKSAADLLLPYGRSYPGSWCRKRLRWTIRDSINGIWGYEPDGGDDDLPCVRVADFERPQMRIRFDDPTLRSVAPSARRRRQLEPGDLLLEKSGGGELQPVGAVVVFDHSRPAVCSNFVARLQVEEGFDSRFLAYLHRSLYVSGITTRSIKQTTGIQNLDQSAYLDEVISSPPLPTQHAIADFLDRKTAHLDGLIEKKQTLLDLLAEKRAALIHQVVTQGLDPSVPMKDSGIPWIGEIPAHWEVLPLKRLAQVRGGITKSGSKIATPGMRSVPYLRVANVQDGFLNLDEMHEIQVHPREIPRYRVQPNDVLMNEGGDNDKLGRGAVWRDEIPLCLHQNHVFAVRPTEPADAEWINLATQSSYLKHYFLGRAKQSTNLASISASNIKEAPIIFPSSAERARILSSVEQRGTALEQVSGRTKASIDRLHEYRQALITAAVTGQLDINGAHAA